MWGPHWQSDHVTALSLQERVTKPGSSFQIGAGMVAKRREMPPNTGSAARTKPSISQEQERPHLSLV